MKVLVVILLILILASDGTSFGRKRSARCRRDMVESLSKSDANLTQDYHYSCDPAEFGIVQKIPYLRSCSACDTIEIDFSSACVRCGMCLAISEKVTVKELLTSRLSFIKRYTGARWLHRLNILQTIRYLYSALINETLLDVHEVVASACLNDTEIEILLRTICDHSFQYYSLREIDGQRYISDRLSGSIMVTTSADGLWGKKLRDLCHYYLDEIGEVALYEQWQQWCYDDEKFPDLSNVMCRSVHGTLRDCRSIGDTEKYKSPFETYNAKVKITASYDKYAKRS